MVHLKVQLQWVSRPAFAGRHPSRRAETGCQTETEELDEREGSILMNMISQLVSSQPRSSCIPGITHPADEHDEQDEQEINQTMS